MKCTVAAGELLAALEIAQLTIDKKPGSELGYLYIGAKKSAQGERLLIHACNSISRTLIRVAANVTDPGDLIIDPDRLMPLIRFQPPDAPVTFSEGKTKDVLVRAGTAKCSLRSADAKAAEYEPDMQLFPKADPLFLIESNHLRLLLNRVAAFVSAKENTESYKSVLLRSIDKGYEAIATNGEVVALAQVEDSKSPGIGTDGKPRVQVQISSRALNTVMKILSRNKKEIISVIVIFNEEQKPIRLLLKTDSVYFATSYAPYPLPAIDVVFSNQNMQSTVIVDRLRILDSLHRSDPFCQGTTLGYRIVELNVMAANLTLKAKDNYGEFEEKIALEAPPIGDAHGNFNVQYISEILRHANEAKKEGEESPDNVTIKLGTTGPNKRFAALIEGGQANGSQYVVGAIVK